MVIDYLLQQLRTSIKNYGIAYVYFDYMDQDQQKPLYVLTSLVKQLAYKLPSSSIDEIEKLYQTLQAEKPPRTPTFKELYTVFIAMSKSFDRVFLVFDALDECDPDNQRKDLLPLFHNLAKVLSLFVASRPHPEDIQDSLHDAAQIELSANEEDIEIYIRQRINDSPRAKRLVGQAQCKDKIISDLADCAKGM